MSLVAVMLYDFQDRKFLPREHRGEELIQEVRDVEDCLHRLKTKLAASLARCRIKHDLLSIDCILPESLRRNQERASSLPLYAWVNSLKSSVEKLCGLGPHTAGHLLSGEGDLLLAGCFSGLSLSHAASLVAEDDRGDRGGCRVLACVGDRTTQQQEELQGVLATMGCKNVGLIPQDFQTLEGDDPRLQRVRVILLTPQCSVSAVSNPVDFILRENRDRGLLPYLSQGSVAQGKLEALVAQQTKDLHHALNFPQVRAVVYCTVSLFPEENEEVVWRCLEQNKARTKQEVQNKLQNFGPSPVLPSFLAPPEGCEKPFFRLEPTAHNNGCFLAVLTREPEPVVEETPQEVLSRANAKGLLDKIGVYQPSARKAKKAPCCQPSKTTVTPASASTREVGDCLRQSAEAVPYKGVALPSALIGATFNPFLTRMAPPTAPPPLVAVVTPTRARPCLVLKPLALTLPPVQLPNFQQANHSRAGAGWGGCIPTFSCHSWRPALSQAGFHHTRSSSSLNKDLQPRPWL
ncbi:unnamed protein product [Lota lota]